MEVSQIEPKLFHSIMVCSGTLVAVMDASSCLDLLFVAGEKYRLVSQSSEPPFVPMNVALRHRRA